MNDVAVAAPRGGRNNPAVARPAIGRYLQIEDDKVLEESYHQLNGTAEIKSYPSAEGLGTILDDSAKKLRTARTANSRDFMEARFIQDLDKSGIIDGLYR